jgi:hypothetical protein
LENRREARGCSVKRRVVAEFKFGCDIPLEKLAIGGWIITETGIPRDTIMLE